jgi:hypothetical protein
VLVALAAMWAIDLGVRAGSVQMDGRWDRLFLENASPYQPDWKRVLGEDSAVTIGGLWSRVVVHVELTASSALPKAQVVTIHGNGIPLRTQDVGGREGVLRFDAISDGRGRLRLTVTGQSQAAALRVSSCRVLQDRPARVSARRLLLYAILFIAVAALVQCLGLHGAGTLLVLLATMAGLGAAVACSRLYALASLPRLVLAVGLGLAFALVGRLVGFPRASLAWVAGALIVRFLLGLHPAFPAVDVFFHAHKLSAYEVGTLITSHVGGFGEKGVLPIPYPPLLYAVLSPFLSSGASAETLLRLAAALLEGTAPFVVYGLMRAAGATREAAGFAGAALAAMPEGLLVLAKGIAANILGSWIGLGVLWSAVAGAAWLLVPASALALLAHPGSSACLLGLLGSWTTWFGGRQRRRLLVSIAIGLLIAWLVYYRHVVSLTAASLARIGSAAGQEPAVFFDVRWIHVGKLLQNVVLKFGLTPVALAWVGFRSSRCPVILRSLLVPWLALGALLGALAVVTPLAVRFEYFLAPAVAMAAGVGLVEWSERHGRASAHGMLAVSALIQLGLGALLLAGCFDVIDVIIPSPRWQPWRCLGSWF